MKQMAGNWRLKLLIELVEIKGQRRLKGELRGSVDAVMLSQNHEIRLPHSDDVTQIERCCLLLLLLLLDHKVMHPNLLLSK
jgi:hypothetical protein